MCTSIQHCTHTHTWLLLSHTRCQVGPLDWHLSFRHCPQGRFPKWQPAQCSLCSRPTALHKQTLQHQPHPILGTGTSMNSAEAPSIQHPIQCCQPVVEGLVGLQDQPRQLRQVAFLPKASDIRAFRDIRAFPDIRDSLDPVAWSRSKPLHTDLVRPRRRQLLRCFDTFFSALPCWPQTCMEADPRSAQMSLQRPLRPLLFNEGLR